MRWFWTAIIAMAAILASMLGFSGTAFAEGSLAVSPTSGPSGISVTVTGSGFASSDYPSGLPIQVNVDHGNGNWENLTTVAMAQPDANGDISVQFRIPSSAPAGLLAISAFTGSGASPSASFTVTGSGASGSQEGTGSPPGYICGGEPCGSPRPNGSALSPEQQTELDQLQALKNRLGDAALDELLKRLGLGVSLNTVDLCINSGEQAFQIPECVELFKSLGVLGGPSQNG